MDDSTATVEQLKGMVKRFCEERDWDRFHTPKDLAIGISTEANELLALFRFRSDEESMALLKDKRKEVGEELADVLYFTLRFAQMYGFDLSQELEDKLKEDAVRYPVEKSRGSNRKYTEL